MCGADVLALTVSISVYINDTFQDLFILILAMHLETIATNNNSIICRNRKNTFLYQVSIYNRRQQK